MKAIILLFVLAASTAVAKPKAAPTPAQTVTREDLRKTVAHMKELAAEQQRQITSLEQANAVVRVEAAETKGSLNGALAKLADFDAQVKKQTTELNASIDARLKLQKQNDELTAKNRRLKFIVCGAIAGLALLGCLALRLPAFFGWGIYATAGAPFLAFSAAWLLL